MRKLGQMCATVLAVALLSMCLSLIALRLLGMATFVVTGSSMEPAIQKGALALVEPVSPSVVGRGDIITFEHYGQMTTHRVIAIDASNAAHPTFMTKGDANAVADPEPIRFPGQVGVFRASVPLLGYVIVYAQAYGRSVFTAIAALAFLICAAMLVTGNVKALRPRNRREGAQPLREDAQPLAIDHDDVWANHLGWLREATARRVA